MFKNRYYNLNELLELIDLPNREYCYKILSDNLELFSKAYGSSHNHQAWEGGYLDHLTEVMNIAVILYEPLNSKRTLPFSLSDALLVLYLHDLEKPWKHLIREGKIELNPELKDKRTQVKEFVKKKVEEYGFVLTSEHWNGIWYAEGEHEDYSSKEIVQQPLAAFVHMCDVWSARGWFDYPKDNDSWGPKLIIAKDSSIKWHSIIFKSADYLKIQKGKRWLFHMSLDGYNAKPIQVGDGIVAVAHESSPRGFGKIVSEVSLIKLADISEEDVKLLGKSLEEYRNSWDGIHPDAKWETNPEVYRIRFRNCFE